MEIGIGGIPEDLGSGPASKRLQPPVGTGEAFASALRDAWATDMTSSASLPAVGSDVAVDPAASFDISDAARIALTAVAPSPDAGLPIEGPIQPV